MLRHKYCIALFLSALSATAQCVTFRLLPFSLVTDDNSQAYGISGDGSTILGASQQGIKTTACFWRGNTVTRLGGDASIAIASSRNGSVIAGLGTFGPEEHAFWYNGGALNYIVDPAGIEHPTDPIGISADGTVLVGRRGLNWQPFRYTIPTSSFQLLKSLDPFDDAFATAATEHGETVVGKSRDSAGWHAVSWGGDPNVLNTILPLAGTRAEDVTADGSSIVGVHGAQGFRLKGGTETNFAITNGGHGLEPRGVSKDGRVVVGYYFKDLAPRPSGFIWMDFAGWFDFDDLLSSFHVVPAGYQVESVTGISESGMQVCGTAVDTSGHERAFSCDLTGLLPAIDTFDFVSATIVGGNNATARLRLTAPAPVAMNVGLSVSSTVISSPSTVSFSVGQQERTFPITTQGVSVNTIVYLTGSRVPVNRSARLVLTPAALASVVVKPISIVGGGTAIGTVSLNGKIQVNGDSATLSSSDTTVATVPASLALPFAASSRTFNVTTKPVVTMQDILISCVFRGVTKTAHLKVLPPSLSSIILPVSIVGGHVAAATVALNGLASSAGATVNLTGAPTGLFTVASPLNILPNTKQRTASVNVMGVDTPTPLTITATYAGVTKSATTTVLPAPLNSIYCSRPNVTGGTNATGYVSLAGFAGPAGATVALTSDTPTVAAVPASASVPQNNTLGSFIVTTKGVAADTSIGLTAEYAGVKKAFALTVIPATLYTLTTTTPIVPGGGTAQIKISLNGQAPPSGALVDLTSSDPATLPLPAQAKIIGYGTSVTVPSITHGVTFDETVVITATYSGVSRTLSVRVTAR